MLTCVLEFLREEVFDQWFLNYIVLVIYHDLAFVGCIARQSYNHDDAGDEAGICLKGAAPILQEHLIILREDVRLFDRL